MQVTRVLCIHHHTLQKQVHNYRKCVCVWLNHRATFWKDRFTIKNRFRDVKKISFVPSSSGPELLGLANLTRLFQVFSSWYVKVWDLSKTSICMGKKIGDTGWGVAYLVFSTKPLLCSFFVFLFFSSFFSSNFFHCCNYFFNRSCCNFFNNLFNWSCH